MDKSFKSITAGLTDSQLAVSVRESAHQVWLAGIGAVAITQEEGSKVFDALVKDGEVIQARTLKLADKQIAAVAEKAAHTMSRLEHVFENSAERALGSLGVPSKKDLDKLSRRIGELSAVVQELKSKREARPVHA